MSDLGETIMWLIPDEASLRGLRVTQLSIDMPIEIYPRHGDSGLRLDGNAPSQSFGTSFMPVFHRVRVTIEAEPSEPVPPDKAGPP